MALYCAPGLSWWLSAVLCCLLVVCQVRSNPNFLKSRDVTASMELERERTQSVEGADNVEMRQDESSEYPAMEIR